MYKQDHIISFIKDYEKLCNKYGILISGCGCMGSPYLKVIEDNKELDKNADHLLSGSHDIIIDLIEDD